ncbi:sensor histidine kinase [Pseudomonas sp. NPDC090208]
MSAHLDPSWSDGGRSRTENELTAAIAHEICQPLLGISSNAAAGLRWLQRDTPNLEEAVAALQDIRAGCERVASIVKALQALARQSPLRPFPTCIDDIIGEVLSLVAPALAKRNVTLDTALDARRIIPADPIQIHQLLFNLITNALEAMSEARCTGGRIRITSATLAGVVEVCVDDNGPGIPAERRQQIFTAFYTTKRSGLGMGLAICKSVVEAHHGSLFAETSDIGGARIRFHLPATCQVS